MKRNLSILLLLFINFAAAQPVVNRVFADTFIITKRDTTPAEFILRNATKNVSGGVLTNLGNGRTAFVTPTQGTVINGNGFVKANGSSISYDNNSYVNLNGTYANPTWITSLAYSKLTGTPTIPAAQVNSDWNATTGLAQILNKPTIPSAANPTATVGLSAVNGTATTFMRSDAAPAINLGIVPTWTGSHTFTAPTVFNTTATANNNQIVGFSFSSSPVCAVNNLGYRSSVYTNFGSTLSIMSNAYASTQIGNQIIIGSYGTFNQTTGVNMMTFNSTFNTQGSAINNIINLTPTINLNAVTTSSSVFTPINYEPIITGNGLDDAQHRFINATHGNVLIGTTSGSLKVGGGTTINPRAIAEFVSTNQGILPPRMTAAQASAIAVQSTDEGLILYVTTTNGTFTSKGWWGYNGASWEKLNN